jgi:hypothetical protein
VITRRSPSRPLLATRLSFTGVSKFDYRRSAAGPSSGLLQCQVGVGAPFTDIASISYPVNTSGGASLSPIDLSGVPSLQNVPDNIHVTFRIVNFGGTNPGGTWYIFDVASNSRPTGDRWRCVYRFH